MPDPQTQKAPLPHGPGRQVLPEPAGPRLRGGGPDDRAGDGRHRIQGGRHEALPFARGGPPQRRGRRPLDIQVPEHEMVLEMLAGLEGGLNGEGAPLPHSDMGWHTRCPPTGSRSSGWGPPGPCPARGTASATRRPRTSSRRSGPSPTAVGRETTPISSRGIWRGASTGAATCASGGA